MCFSQELIVVKGAGILPLPCVEYQIPAPTSHGSLTKILSIIAMHSKQNTGIGPTCTQDELQKNFVYTTLHNSSIDRVSMDRTRSTIVLTMVTTKKMPGSVGTLDAQQMGNPH